MELTRRDFLKAGGVAVSAYSLLSLTGCVRRNPLWHEWQWPSGKLEEKHVASVCLQCPGGCGIIVRTVNGRAVKIEGNPLYPSNQGGTCPKGQMGLQILYDPDRIKGPMKQTGERGDVNGFRPISWDEGIKLLAAKLSELRARGEPHTLAVVGGRYRGQMHSVLTRFMKAYGTPNDIKHSSICEDGTPMSNWVSQGWKSYGAYDWKNCDYVISFGGNFLEAWRPTASLLRAWGDMRRGRGGRRTKFVMVDPRFSVVSAKADEWLPVNPGTDAALALGMAHVIVRDGLYDTAFISEHTFGFDDWSDEHGPHRGFKDYVLKEWPVERASDVSGIPADRIEWVAREFASKAPHCIAAGARGTSMQTNGVFTRFAIHALNALVGSVDAVGGVLTQIGPPLAPWPEIVSDDTAKQGLSHGRVDYAGTVKYPLAGKVYQDLPDRILEGKPYPVNAMLLYYTNPMFSSPAIKRWDEAIKKVPFIASLSPFLDETTANADLILPDDTYLERMTDDVIYPSLGFPIVGMRQPVVDRVFDTRNVTDTIIALVKEMGGNVAESFPWKDAEDMLKSRYRGVFESSKGMFTAATADEWWKKFRKLGVWADPPYPYAQEHPEQWPRVLVHYEKEKAGKEPGKFMFYSLHLKHKLEHKAEAEAEKNGTAPEEEFEKMLEWLRIGARGDELYFPHTEKCIYVGDEKEYPLVFITYKTIAHAEGRGANTPMAQERLNVQTGERWTTDLQLNPTTAKSLGLTEGDDVWIESPIGRIRSRVRFMPHHPSVAVMPFELGHRHYGRWAKGRGSNPNEIIANENNRLGGLSAWYSTRVKVYKA